ncbi:MAG: 2-isopropylmalate synthase [Lentisphaeria bacterium]
MSAPRYAAPSPITIRQRDWPGKTLTRRPDWCAVDLRDGNQALPDPMTPARKRRYFELLCQIGFKEVEVGFPSASADDFNFCRALITDRLIPEDVTISVLTQSREHLIRRTVESLVGVRRAIFHLYAATSELHMRYVFGKTPAETQAMVLESVRLTRQLCREQLPDSQVLLEFSPEEFTDSDLDFTVALCDAVVEAWDPAPGEKVILNLPATVERRLPNEYADMIEEFRRRQRHGARSIISLHAHNDMGTAVAATELALLAGGERVEGTLFGHGERCGNVDLITLALNLQYLGVDTGLQFTQIETLRDELAELTAMPVHPRHPYAGELVFTAFSGSHQDAIHKGLSEIDELSRHFKGWKIPYLHINPSDLGRQFEKFIRINSQSGKGGIAFILQKEHGIQLPRPLLLEFSGMVQKYADSVAREVSGDEIWDLLRRQYLRADGAIQLQKYWPRPNADDPTRIAGEVRLEFHGKPHLLTAEADGPIAAFVRAVRQLPLPFDFTLTEYEEDAIGQSDDAEAVTFVRLQDDQGHSCRGIGFGGNIDQAAVRAVVSALNGLLETTGG